MSVGVVLVCGLPEPWDLRRAGPAFVHWDGTGLVGGAGVVLRWSTPRRGRQRSTVLALQHPCLSCAVRQDLVPAVLATGEPRVLVALPPGMVPADALVALRGRPGLHVEQVVTVVDPASWLDHVLDETPLADLGWELLPGGGGSASATLLGQVEVSAVLACSTPPPSGLIDVWRHVAPDAVVRVGPVAELLRTARPAASPVPGWARLLQHHDPALESVGHAVQRTGGVTTVLWRARCAVHPERLHAAVAELMAMSFRSRGRLWLPARPAQRVRWDHAGSALVLEPEGTWVAAGGPEAWLALEPSARAWLDAHWDPEHGDRMQELVITGSRRTHLDPGAVLELLRECLVPHDEGCVPALLPDPFAEHLSR